VPPIRAYAPSRPDAVPSNAIWKGGVDGGRFYLCDLSTILKCTVYNDHSGDIEKSGIVELADWQKSKYKTVAEVYQDLESFDGERIHFAITSASALR
jgi:hypothetical protein